MREELEHVRRSLFYRVLADHREERLQIERNRPHRVRPRPPSHELQIAIHQRITKAIPLHARRRNTPDQGRKR